MAKLRKNNTKVEAVEVEATLTIADINAMTVEEMHNYIKENNVDIKGYYDLKSAELKVALKSYLGLTEETPEAESKEEPEEISVIDNAVANAKATEEATPVITGKTAKEPNVRVNPKQDIRTYVGDQWYNLKAGKIVSVPKTVKDKLNKAGLLNPI